MPNTAEWPIVLLGAMEAGIPVCTANINYTGGKYTDNARSKLGGFGYVLLEERTPRKVKKKFGRVTSRNRGTPNYNTLCSVRGIYCTAI
jgi:acyl-CoA synthetase (AMP-forming)/AMP-acid ligase II